MKKVLFYLLLVSVVMVLCTASSRKVPFDYNGVWSVGTKVDAEIGGQMYFYLKLKHEGDRITGTYYSISPKMARKDCNVGNSIEGVVKKNIAKVVFKSAEWGGGGVAELRPVDKNTIVWHIESEQRTGNADFGHWCPNRTKLERK